MPNSYIDIPISNEYFSLFNLDENDYPVSESVIPIGVGIDSGIRYSLVCEIDINQILSLYNLTSSNITSLKLNLFGNSFVEELYIYKYGSQTPIDIVYHSGYDYEIKLNSNYYDNTYGGYLFKMVAPKANRYNEFDTSDLYLRIEFIEPSVSSIYVDAPNSRNRFFNGETLHKSDFTVKAVLSNNTEFTLTNFTSPLFEATLNPSITSINITAQIGTITGYSCSFNITVVSWARESLDVAYAGTSSDSNQVFDIYVPLGSANQTFPVVITIHGGHFCGGQKEDYNYITPFLINNGCIHVNMNYRLMPIPEENNNSLIIDREHYTGMISDIDALINHLYNHSIQYHININKIGLMGYSAGGNIAFNYTLRSYLNSGDDAIQSAIPIKLIITQGAPFFSELIKANNDLEIEYNDSNPYINNPANITNIKNEIKVLIGFGTAYELELSKIKPLSFLQNGQSFPINLFIQGTGFNDYGYQAQEYQLQSIEYQGDGFISEKGINTLIEQRWQANDVHKTLIKFCFHSNYNTMTFTDSDCLSDLEDTIEDFVDLVC